MISVIQVRVLPMQRIMLVSRILLNSKQRFSSICTHLRSNQITEVLEEWAWIVYPWNFIEDMISSQGLWQRKNLMNEISKR